MINKITYYSEALLLTDHFCKDLSPDEKKRWRKTSIAVGILSLGIIHALCAFVYLVRNFDSIKAKFFSPSPKSPVFEQKSELFKPVSAIHGLDSDKRILKGELLHQAALVGIVSDPIPPLRSNAIDPMRGKTWVEMHPEEHRPLAQKFLSSIKHYSFSEFEEGLKNSIESFNATLMGLPNEERDYTLLVGPWGSKSNIQTRSNSWVTSIALKYLAHLPKSILNYNQEITQSDCENIHRILFIDDAAYSGTQICNTITDLKINISDPSSLTVHLAIPFISNYALKRIRQCISDQQKMQYVLEKHIEFPTIKKIFTREERIQLNEIRGIAQYRTIKLASVGASLSLTYFDHKIPDSSSTFSETFTRGQLLVASHLRIPAILRNEGLIQTDNASQEEVSAYNRRYNEILNTQFHYPFIPQTLPPYKTGVSEDLENFLSSLDKSNVGENPVLQDYMAEKFPSHRYVVFQTVKGIFAVDRFGCNSPVKLSRKQAEINAPKAASSSSMIPLDFELA